MSKTIENSCFAFKKMAIRGVAFSDSRCALHAI